MNPGGGEMTLAKAKDQLCKILNSIGTPGGFAKWHVLQDADLKVNVNGVGAIRLPLQPNQAEQIIATARPYPTVTGRQTHVDTFDGKTWELDFSEFKLPRPQGWDRVLDEARLLIFKGLGLDRGIDRKFLLIDDLRLEPHKMLLYEPGARAYTDFRKIRQQFATLVVVLPSEHTGGDLILEHNQQKFTFKPSQPGNANGISLMFWYTNDVKPQATPVISGYRWVLTYNVIIKGVGFHLPKFSHLPDSSPAGLVNALSQWADKATEWTRRTDLRELAAERAKRSYEAERLSDRRGLYREEREEATNKRKQVTDPRPQRAVYTLDHRYTEEILNYGSARGRDAGVLEALRTASESLPIHLFLANLEKVQTGYYYRNRYGFRYHEKPKDISLRSLDIVEIAEYSIKAIHSPDGHQLGKSSSLEQDDLLRKNSLLHEDNIDYFFGHNLSRNGGRHSEHYSAVVLVPHNDLHQNILSSARVKSSPGNWISREDNSRIWMTHISNWICDVSKLCTGRDVKSITALNILFELCNHTWEEATSKFNAPEMRSDAATNLLLACLQAGNLKSFEECFLNVKELFDVQLFTERIRSLTSDPDSRICSDDIKEQLSLVFDDFTDAEALPKPTPGEDGAGSHRGQDGQAQAAPPTSADTQRTAFGYHHGKAFVEHCMSCPGRPSDEESGLLQRLQKRAGHTGYALGCLFGLAENATQAAGTEQYEVWKNMYHALAESVIYQMDISTLVSTHTIQSELQLLDGKYYYTTTSGGRVLWSETNQDLTTAAVDYEWLANFFTQLITFGYDGYARTLAIRIASSMHILTGGLHDKDAKFKKHCALLQLWIPFLKMLISLLKDRTLESCGNPAAEKGGPPEWSHLPPYQRMFVAVLEAYLVVAVGKYPLKPTLERHRMPCECDGCSEINTFLADKHGVEYSLRANEELREHIQQQILNNNVDCSMEVQRHTRPFMLCLTKTTDHYEQACLDWDGRRMVAAKVLQGFPRRYGLKPLLGDILFPRIMNMEKLTENRSS